MRRFLALALAFAAVLCLCSCSGGDQSVKRAVAGKAYVWEKIGFGGNFTIKLYKDGTYEYYEGYLSSYIGSGTWTVEDGVIILTEKGGYDFTFRFSRHGTSLKYIADGSDRFMYVDVEDGDKFVYAGNLEPRDS